MGKQLRRARRKIQSGMGDKNHLLAQKPQRESATEQFKARWKLEGKVQHSEKVYNAVDAKYSYYYKGQRIDMSNESPYYVDVNAHPKRCFPYSVEQHKKLPFDRLWEARADFEATVIKRTLNYGIEWQGTKQVEAPMEYKIHWSATGLGDALAIFNASASNRICGSGQSSNSYNYVGDKLIDYENQNFMTGTIADPAAIPDTTTEVTLELTVKPVHSKAGANEVIGKYQGAYLEGNQLKMMDSSQFNPSLGGRDDDAVGFIFGAKRNGDGTLSTGYLVLWESHHRVPGSRRLRKNINGFDMKSSSIAERMASGGDIRTERWAINDKTLDPDYPKYEKIFDGQDDFKLNSATNLKHMKNHYNDGWGNNHMRLFKISNNSITVIDSQDSGSKKGWQFNKEHKVKLEIKDGVCKFYAAQPGGSLELQFTVNMASPEGTIGLCNLSQAVEYSNGSIRLTGEAGGTIPSNGWDSHEGGEKVLAENATNYVKPYAQEEFPELTDLEIKDIWGETNGSGEVIVESLTGKIILKTGTSSEPVGGRIPTQGWFEWDGFEGDNFVGSFVHAPDIESFVKQEADLGTVEGLEITGYNGIVENPEAGYVTTIGDFVAHSSNAPDAGTTYYETYYKCGVQNVTPDNYDKSTCVTAFSDIAALFMAEDNEFFNRRPDWDPDSFKREYSLTKPVPPPDIDPDTGREIIESNENSDCVIYGPEVPPGEVPACTIDFHFDGVSLCMWGCEFPIEIDVKEFENCVFAYEGMRQFFPLEEFDPNKWTIYKIFPLESAIKTDLDYFAASDDQDLMNVAIGSYIEIKTDEYYEIRFPEEIPNIGEVTTEQTIEIVLPSFPEHFVDPIYHRPAIEEGSREIRYLLDVWENKEDVAIRWITDKTPLNGMYDVNPSEPTWDGILEYSKWHTNIPAVPKAVIGEVGMKLMYVSERRNDQVQGRHFIQIQCLERATITEWNSGMIIGHVSVNGGYPLLGAYKGKRDVRGIELDNLFFPKDLIPESLIGPIVSVEPEYVNWKVESDKTLTLSSDYMTDHEWYTDWVSDWNYDSKTHSLTYGNFETEAKHVFDIESFVNKPKIDVKKLEINDLVVESDNPFVELSVGQLSDDDKMLIKMNMNGSKKIKIPVHGYFKKTYPYPWSPMVHSGYYYMEEQEKYLYANPKADTIMSHEQKLSSRPRQGAPILARNNKGEMLTKTMGFDQETLMQSHVNSQSFVGTGHSKYRLNQRGILKDSLVVYINDRLLDKEEFLFTEIDNNIQFMRELKESDHVYIEFSIEKSFYVDMFEGLFNSSADVSLNFHGSNLMTDLQDGEIFYEGSTQTPFYYASEVQLNPLRQNVHSGFLYIDEDVERKPHSLKVRVSHTYVDVNSGEKVILVAEVLDEYGNPLEDVDVEFYENGNKLATSKTNLSGEATLTIIPDINAEFVTRIGAKVNNLHHAVQINNTKPFISKRKYIEMKADRYEFIAGKPSGIINITATLRDENWLKVKGEQIKVTIVNTKGITQQHTIVTAQNGQASISINALNESKGEILVKMEHGQNDELAMNFLYIRVAGE